MSGSSKRESSSSKHTRAPTSSSTKKPEANIFNRLGLVNASSRPSSSKPTTVASRTPTEKIASKHVSSSSTKSGFLSKPQGTAMPKLDASVRPSSSSRREPTQQTPTKLFSSRLEANASSSSSSRRESSQGLATRIPTSLPSRPGPSVLASSSDRLRSTFRTKYDVEMANRQLKIDTLSRAERAEQEKRAAGQLKMHEKSCPANLPWNRIPEGYQCYGLGHIVTHELLAEGKGGLLYDMGNFLLDENDWQGPFYGSGYLGCYASTGEI